MIISIIITIFFIIFFVVFYERYNIKKIRDNSWREAEKLMILSSQSDPLWNKETIINFTKNVFNAYYSAWATLNPKILENLLSESFYKKTVLEMSVVSSLGRRYILNLKSDIKISIVEAKDVQGNLGDIFTAEIEYSKISGSIFKPQRTLRDNKKIFSSKNTEYWRFVREDSGWKLSKIWTDYFIRPNVGTPLLVEEIQKFSDDNGFFYDPDFGDIMLPDKGILFNKYRFSRKVSNHTIGMWDNKILEFYMYYGCDGNDDNKTCRNYIVSQAILPKRYNNMIIESKNSDLSTFSNIGTPLEKIETESVEFNKKFSVYRSKDDRVNILELLPPNFMEHLLSINFPLYIEIADNVLYVCSNNLLSISLLSLKNIPNLPANYDFKNNVNYNDMLKILCWAFDEMKM
ncbi:MAG: DUF3137 domain-containing protein [Candidatus Woesearchaeota archaeon]